MLFRLGFVKLIRKTSFLHFDASSHCTVDEEPPRVSPELLDLHHFFPRYHLVVNAQHLGTSILPGNLVRIGRSGGRRLCLVSNCRGNDVLIDRQLEREALGRIDLATRVQPPSTRW